MRGFNNALLSAGAWGAPVLVGAFLVSDWDTLARWPLIAFFALCVAYRAWVRVGNLEPLDGSRFRFTRLGKSVDVELSDISWVTPSGVHPDGTALFIALKPAWRRPILLVGASEDILDPWARAGVRVLSPFVGPNERADAFFGQEDDE